MLILTSLVIYTSAFVLTQPVDGACTPNDVKVDLNKCLQYQSMNTFYQFPLRISNYSSLCNNSTCFAYCIETVIQNCQSHSFMSFLSSGEAIKAAYLGFCSQNESNINDDLTCMANGENQAALNIISTFETKWQGYYVANTANNDTICTDWITMYTDLDALLTANCTESTYGLTVWQTFLNTIVSPCSTQVPSFYTDFSSTSVTVCNRATALSINLELIILIAMAGFQLWHEHFKPEGHIH